MYSFSHRTVLIVPAFRIFPGFFCDHSGDLSKGTLALVGGSDSGSGRLGVLLPKKTLSRFCLCHSLFQVSSFSSAHFPMKKLKAVKIPDEGECCGLSGGPVHSPEAGLKVIFTPTIGPTFRTSHHTTKM